MVICGTTSGYEGGSLECSADGDMMIAPGDIIQVPKMAVQMVISGGSTSNLRQIPKSAVQMVLW